MDNFTNTIERIMYFIDCLDISINKFSVNVGVSNSYFNKMAKMGSSVGSDILEKIIRAYPELNANWLIAGSGEMFLDKNTGEVLPSEEMLPAKERLLLNMLKEKYAKIDELNQQIGRLEQQIISLKNDPPASTYRMVSEP